MKEKYLTLEFSIISRNTAVQSKTALAVAAFVCDADSRENVCLTFAYHFILSGWA